MKVAIIQSCFAPWVGYFDFIDDVDLFILLDDVQFTKNDWRNRNLIKTSYGLRWLTVPIYHKNLNKTIYETEIDYSSNWVKRHANLLRTWYCKSLHFDEYYNDYNKIIFNGFQTISDLNIELINWFLKKFRINTRIMTSIHYKPKGTKTHRILDLLKKCGASSYLTGPSAKNYLDEPLILNNGIEIFYKSYVYKPYQQLWGKFVSNVSALDLLFNMGPDAKNFLKSIVPNIDSRFAVNQLQAFPMENWSKEYNE